MAIWINDYDCEDPTEIGWLVCRTNQQYGNERYSLQEHPAHINQSREPKLNGWCGAWNDTSTSACGLARVVRVAKNGRMCLARVEPTAEILETLGYPELAEEAS